MEISKKDWSVVAVLVLAIVATAVFVYSRRNPTARPVDAYQSANALTELSTTSSSGNAPQGISASAISTEALPNTRHDWAANFAKSMDYFDFVSNAALNAYNGDSRAALYISKALYVCLPIKRQYADSDNPEADFASYWATMTKSPQWVVDKARSDFHLCAGFIKGDAFAALPRQPGSYESSEYWVKHASGDPVAQVMLAGAAIAQVGFDKSPGAIAKARQSAQDAINSAVTSNDPIALFKAGQLLSDGHAGGDPIQGFAVSLAACDLGFDCTVNNADVSGNCIASNTCSPGSQYSDLVKRAVGNEGYAQAYARAQQLEDAIRRSDTTAIQKLIQLKPI